jgi:hypothetical protein
VSCGVWIPRHHATSDLGGCVYSAVKLCCALQLRRCIDFVIRFEIDIVRAPTSEPQKTSLQ